MIETPEEYKSLYAWLNGDPDALPYLPEFMQDFHDQKDLFKEIDMIYEKSEGTDISWVKAHCYTVDRFLYYMASRGYTLQKCRKKNVNFRPLFEYREEARGNLLKVLNNGTDDRSP